MKIALIGNQNSGKTTLFNALTGMNQKIGNWPGVTIEKKEGIIKGTNHEIVDLPGIYSLTPYTMEEQISKDYILKNKVNLIINIVDATSLERSLFLTTELLDLDIQIIVVINMIDRLNSKGLTLDYKKLEEKLGVKICLVSALKEKGIDELINSINTISNKRFNRIKIFPRNIEEIIYDIENRCREGKNARFYAIDNLKNANNAPIKLIQKRIEELYGMEAYETLITLRYEFIENVYKDCIRCRKNKKSITQKLDSIFLNKFLAIPIFIVIMFFIYYISVGVVGNYTVDFIDNLIENFKNYSYNLFETIGVSEWLNSLICNGIITGVGGVISFLPQLSILFLCISILEATGYMSRISFLLDKFFRKLGLSGKALIPFIVGSGCSVPGIMSSRIIEDPYDRKVVSVLTPFIPCSAKLPVIALFTGYFFREHYGLVATSFYIMSILIVIISALIIKKLLRKKYVSSYISELPEYKFPNLKYVLRDVWDKVSEFINKAGTLIFLSSICVWFLLSFSTKMQYGVDIEDSILAYIGKKISWIFTPIIGVNSWEASVSALQGLIAKEQVVSSMEIIAGFSEEFRTKYDIFGTGSPFSFFNTSSSYAYVVFILFSAPCFAAISTMKKELGNVKYTIYAIVFQTLIAWLLGVFVFNFLNFIGV